MAEIIITKIIIGQGIPVDQYKQNPDPAKHPSIKNLAICQAFQPFEYVL